MPPPRVLLVLALVLLGTLGCIEPGVAPEKVQELRTGSLDFLVVGRTTREEVLVRFGTPSARFEGDRILTYDFVLVLGRWVKVGGPTGTVGQDACLVLVFDAGGVLTRQSLVRQERKPAVAPEGPASESPATLP